MDLMFIKIDLGYVALDTIPESQQIYINAALRRQKDFNVSKNIKIIYHSCSKRVAKLTMLWY